MASLLQKIEASARTKLVLEPGRQPSQEIPRYKSFLKVETHRLKIQHRAGADGREICEARAHILDLLLQHFWDASKRSLSEQAQKEFPKMSLIALGGYGRGELNPHSDIDVMFLHNGQVIGQGRAHPYLARMLDGILYPLWDIGLKVGHAVRTLDDCVCEANEEMQSKTAFIEARLISGDEGLFAKFQQTILAKCVVGHEDEYVAARMADQSERRAKFGNSACMQEPNVKNGCGGLRDLQNLIWMSFFKHGTRTLEGLQKKEFISASERKQLESAYDFLLRVRTEMHYLSTRPTDALTKSMQPAVAHGLGYHERSPSQRIEHFMRDLYTHLRNSFLITRTSEQRMALTVRASSRFSLRELLRKRKKPAAAEPVDGFKFEGGQIHAVSSRVFRDAPRRLMRVFLYAQQRGLELHPDLAQMIRNQLSLVDRAFLADGHVHETFLTILNQRGDVARILRAMHEVGFLGKYMPEFGKLTCLVQHEFYHQYAADEHTLMCLEQLDRVWESESEQHRDYSTLFQELENPYLLYLALLLHDVGKADGHGRHANHGGKLAQRVARRLKLEDSDAELLVQLVEDHLIMASTSQRRDLDNPEEIHRFAKQVVNFESLKLLTLLTFVDSLATSDKLWNGFKDALLWTLHRRAARLLSGSTEFIRAEAREREGLREEVRDNLPGSVSDEEVAAHFHALPARYFQAHGVAEIVEDIELTHRFLERQTGDDDLVLKPAIRWHHYRDRGCTEVRICTWDRAGLFGSVAGALSAVGLNILSAQIFTRKDGIALDVFSVTDGKTGSLADTEQMEKFEKVITRVLQEENVDLDELIARQKRARTLYEAYTGERIEDKLSLDNDSVTNRSIIEVETEDRIGLLYNLSKQFAALDVNILAARICTEKGGAIDTFYVIGPDGEKIDAEDHWPKIKQRISGTLRRMASS